MPDPANDSVLSSSVFRVIQLILGLLIIAFFLKELGFLNFQMAPLGSVLIGSCILLALLYATYEWVYIYNAEFTYGLIVLALVAAFLLSPNARRDLKILSRSTYPSKKQTRRNTETPRSSSTSLTRSTSPPRSKSLVRLSSSLNPKSLTKQKPKSITLGH